MTERDEAQIEAAAREQVEHLEPQQAEEVKALGAIVAEEDAAAAPGCMKMDLHCHSEASSDCITPISRLPERCLRRGIRVQAITDHNEIWGAQKLKELVEEKGYPLTVIVGEEVSTAEGEIVGLFLEEKIEAGLSPEDTVAQIREQGGLVLLPHGFDPLKRFRLKEDARARIEDEIDIVETFNARISRPRWNREAVAWAETMGILMSAGSDAHTLADIGSAWVEVEERPVRNAEELLLALEDSVPVGEWTHPVLALGYKMWDMARSRIRAWAGR